MAEEEMFEKQIQFSKSIDFSKVDASDKLHMREIMLHVVQFDDIMPKLIVTFIPTEDHYIVRILGWLHEIDILKCYNKFLNKSTRPTCMEYIQSASIVPCDDEGKACVILRVHRLNRPDSKNFKKKK